MRTTLPARRCAETFDLVFGNIRAPFRVTVGYYADNKTPGEVFITSTKASTEMDATARDGAILLSLAIQHGVPIATIKDALTRNSDGSPSSLVGAVVDILMTIKKEAASV